MFKNATDEIMKRFKKTLEEESSKKDSSSSPMRKDNMAGMAIEAKKGGSIKKSKLKDKVGRAVKRKTADVKGRAMKRGR